MHDTNNYLCADDNEHSDEEFFSHIIQDECPGRSDVLDDDDEFIYIDELITDQGFQPEDDHTESRQSDALEYTEHSDDEENTLQVSIADFKARLFQRIGINFNPCNICNCSNYAGRPFSDETCINCGHFRNMHS